MDKEQPIDLTVEKSSDKGPKETQQQQQQQQEQQQQQQQQQQRQQQKPHTGKRVQFLRSAKVKLMAIQQIKNGATKAAVSRALGVPESTIRGWYKSEKTIRENMLLMSVDDSESCSPTSESPSSTTGDDKNLVLDMSGGRSRSNNFSDKENREPAARDTPNEAIHWAMLMAHQRDNRQQMMSLQMDNVDQAIAIGERFLELLENSDDPSVTTFTVGQVREVLDRLRENRR